MGYANKAPVRIFSMILVVAIVFTAFPKSCFAAIDEPLSGETGSGWDSIDGLPENTSGMPPVTPELPDNNIPDNSAPDPGDTGSGEGEDLKAPPATDESTATVKAATPTTM